MGLTHCVSNKFSGGAAGLGNTWDKSGVSQSAPGTHATNLGKAHDPVPLRGKSRTGMQDWAPGLLVSFPVPDGQQHQTTESHPPWQPSCSHKAIVAMMAEDRREDSRSLTRLLSC